ncbi:MAG: MBL fold metallo-hydrolase [Verrucomicrobiae bacterium]|nr:MBL fold metallo-hydrolase [Verrucomicrobiae bacterium]
MSKWSIDGIHSFEPEPQQDCSAIVRLAHANALESPSSGIRYVGLSNKLKDSDLSEEYRWGRCIEVNWKQLRRNVLLRNLPILEPESDVEFHDDKEESIRGGIEQILAAIDGNMFSQEQVSGEPLSCEVWAKVHVHNVGQGDTIVLELPDNQYWMIDARLWRESRRDEFKKWMKRFEGKRFSKLIVSHFHYDHIHSVPYIIEEYKPDEVVVVDSLLHPTITTQRVLDKAGKSLKVLRGTEYFSFGELKITLFRSVDLPNVMVGKDPNSHEIGVCLCTQRTRAFLAGDMPAHQCEEAIKAYFPSKGKANTYYKVSHHGSRTGNSQTFMNALDPQYSVISCGKGNRFGHPHTEIWKSLPGDVIRTDQLECGVSDEFNIE